MFFWILAFVIFIGGIVLSAIYDDIFIIVTLLFLFLILLVGLYVDNSNYREVYTEDIPIIKQEIPPDEGRYVRIIEEPGSEYGYVFFYYVDGESSKIHESRLDFGGDELKAIRYVKVDERGFWSYGIMHEDKVSIYIPVRIDMP